MKYLSILHMVVTIHIIAQISVQILLIRTAHFK